ncbi:MAG TPA: hypothetical protein VGO03_12450 [Acidimicrobiia bacterium]
MRTTTWKRALRLIEAFLLMLAVLVGPASATASSSLAGSQGTDTSIAAVPGSAVTVSGRNAFSSLKVTVNQTTDLVNQAISISWSGVSPTFSNAATGAFSTTYNGDYLQVFECWGDPSSSDPLNAVDPGPSPTQCQYGGESNTPTSAYPIQENGFEYSRVVSQPSWPGYDQAPGWVDTATGFKIMPFDSVDGTVVNQQANYDYLADPTHPQGFWLEPYFSFNTTNEIPFARTYPTSGSTGSGQTLFQVQTGLEAPGLGCGQKLQPVTSGGTKVPQCWLVIVPRGTPTDENPSGLTGVQSVVTSPLSPSAWANRISIPLKFRPIDTSCSIGAQQTRIVGSELASAAFQSWQPALCNAHPTTPYSYSYLSDDQARQNLTQNAFGGAGLSVFSIPPSSSSTSGTTPVYAPVTLSSVVVGFNIERLPILQSDGTLQPDEVPLAGVRVKNIYLTPRLVAKLLTESYQAQLVDVLASKPAADQWVLKNPQTIVSDPDFLQWNPEFKLLSTQQAVDASGLVVEEPNSDAAQVLWQWVLSDPEAKAWLNGAPDPWGMQVNPIYSTNASVNTSKTAFGTPTPNNYPKSDPYCYDSGETVGSPAQAARPICILDWSPYALNMQDAANSTGSANSQAKTTLNPAATPETAWGANGPQKAGTRFILSITDSADATRYGLQTASLSRAGDDTASRAFTQSSSSSMLSALASMHASEPSGMLVSDQTKMAAGAYPLTMLTYAATVPSTLTTSQRANYAQLLAYSSGAGQVTGTAAGQLPEGYVPLPSALRKIDDAAIQAILHPGTTVPTPTPVTTPPTTLITNTGPSSGSLPGDSSSSTPTTTPSTSPSTTTTTTKPSHTTTTNRAPKPKSLLTKLIGVGPARFAAPAVATIGFVALAAAPFVGDRKRRGLTAARATVVAWFGRARARSRDRNVFDPW